MKWIQIGGKYRKTNVAGEAANCSRGCGACCIAPIIHNDDGTIFKRPRERCRYLAEDLTCEIYNDPRKPKECREFTCRNTYPEMRRALERSYMERK